MNLEVRQITERQTDIQTVNIYDEWQTGVSLIRNGASS